MKINANYSAHGGVVNIQLRSASAFAAFAGSNRLRTNMTRDELAQAVRKCRRWVHDPESSKVTASLGTAIEVGEVLGFTVSLERSERAEEYRTTPSWARLSASMPKDAAGQSPDVVMP